MISRNILKMWSINIIVIYLIATVYINTSTALNILGVFPVAGKSHLIVGEEILKTLASKGHKVDVISHFPQKKNIPNYTDINISGTVPSSVNNMTFQQTQSSTGLKYALHLMGEKLCDLLEHPEFQKVLKKPKKSYDVIIVELFFAQCYLALGQHLDAPVVGLVASKMHDWLYTPFGNSFNPSYIASLMTGHTQQMTFTERFINTYFYYSLTCQFNYYLENQSHKVKKYFNRSLSSIQELYSDVSIVLVNSHYSINEIKPQTPDIIDIGGLHVDSKSELTPDLKKWLDESEEGCVYISFGSMVQIETLPADKLEAFYETFKKISPVRVLMKIAKPEMLPPDLPKNVKISSWLPQIAILKHKNTKAFVTHGGLMGTQESIAWGVPLVGIPLFGDQHANLQSYASKKIAIVIQVESFNAEILTNSIQTVLNDPEYRNNAKEISRLFMDRPMSPRDTAVYWIEYAARHGNRLKSPAVKLTWWQFYLLDVYACILAAVIIIIYISKKLLCFGFRICFSKNKDDSKKSIVTKKNK